MPRTKDRFRVPVPSADKVRLDEIAKLLVKELPPGKGFALFTFDFAPEGPVHYVSNADRGDMVQAIAEFIRQEGD